MKHVAVIALAMLLPAAAHAGDRAEREAAAAPVSEANRFKAALPPIEYDRPYKGILLEVRGDKEAMARLCPKTSMPVTLGCAYAHATDCTIVIANDDIIRAAGWTYDIVYRHERSHCVGWPKDHPRARPVG